MQQSNQVRPNFVTFAKTSLMEKILVYAAVFTTQDRKLDECGHGYLPRFNAIFGIYENLWDAIGEVSKYLYDHEEYEILEDTPSTDDKGNTIGWNYTFSYADKHTSAFGYYELEIIGEYITPKQ